MSDLTQNKPRTNVSLTGEDVELLNNIKKLIANKSKTKKLSSSAHVIRSALEAYQSILIEG